MLRGVSIARLFGVALVAVLALWWSGHTAWGQPSALRGSVEELYARSMLLYHQARYASAETYFRRVAKAPQAGRLRQSEASYYAALCAVRLGRHDAVYQMVRFLQAYPESLYANAATYEIGQALYDGREFNGAQHWLGQVSLEALDGEQEAEVNFKRGYCYWEMGQPDSAMVFFTRVKDGRSYYWSAATYYYAHRAYEQGRYGTARREFARIADDASFGPIVPYYMAQIYYREGDYAQVGSYVPTLLEGATKSRKAELLRILGDAQYRLGEDSLALATWQRYEAEGNALTRTDQYMLGLLCYRNARYEQAVGYLAPAALGDDSYAQHASYYLAACYLHLNDKEKALSAFGRAAQSPYDTVLAEDAQFNYAKLTYESSGALYTGAVKAFEDYIARYPWSQRLEDAYGYLGLSLGASRNYQQALDVLSRIRKRTPILEQAVARAAYFRGLELLQNSSYAAADSLLQQAIESSEGVPPVHAGALYWAGEANYKLQRYPLAAKHYRDFLVTAGSVSMGEYNLAYYNLGYCHYQMANYQQGAEGFREFLARAPGASEALRTDAACRYGDCLYMARQYWPAIDAYALAAKLTGPGSDYALYQMGLLYGVVERPAKAAEVLLRFEHEHPQSPYRVQAFYQLGLTYQNLGNTAAAQRYFARVVEDYGSSAYASRALVQQGLLAYGSGANEQARGLFRRVVKDYPGTSESAEALAALERIYAQEGAMSQYLSYVDSLGVAEPYSATVRDSLVYSSAMGPYYEGHYGKASKALKEYLAAYKMGLHWLEANYFLGRSLCAMRDTAGAIEPLRVVVEHRPAHAYTVDALRLLAAAQRAQKDYQDAAYRYRELAGLTSSPGVKEEAYSGELTCAVAQRDTVGVIRAARALLGLAHITPEHKLQASYWQGRGQEAQGDLDGAYASYASIAANSGSSAGAEAYYRMVAILRARKDWEGVRRAVVAFSKQNTPHQYWLAKSFIVLAEAYRAKGDMFQAQATLESIASNYGVPDDGILREVEQALQTLKAEAPTQVTAPGADTLHLQGPKKEQEL